jgi:hypothetical protein
MIVSHYGSKLSALCDAGGSLRMGSSKAERRRMNRRGWVDLSNFHDMDVDVMQRTNSVQHMIFSVHGYIRQTNFSRAGMLPFQNSHQMP